VKKIEVVLCFVKRGLCVLLGISYESGGDHGWLGTFVSWCLGLCGIGRGIRARVGEYISHILCRSTSGVVPLEGPDEGGPKMGAEDEGAVPGEE